MKTSRLAAASLWALSLSLLLPTLAFASPVIRTGESVDLKEDQSVPGDFYALGGTVSISARIEGDMYVAAGAVTVNGPIAADLVIAAGTVQVHSTVGDDVRVAGGQIIIADKVAGDVLVFGGDVAILSTAEIGGDILFFGGSLDLKGRVQGSVFGTGGEISIDSAVAGDVTAKVGGPLTLGSHADIGGDVTYASPEELSRALESVIVGEVVRRDEESLVLKSRYQLPIFPFLAILFSAFALRFIFGEKLDALLNADGRKLGIQGLIGFGLFIVVPLAVILLCISVIGALVGAALFFLYLFLLAASVSLSVTLFGAEMARLWQKKPEYGVLWTSLGALFLIILFTVPVVGPFVTLASTLIIFGGIAMRIYEKVR